MNKNDLRYIKTERLIVHTYVDIRLRDPSPVKVSDLCREALINKTTFYSHYDTMESLRRHICRETVADILGRCDCARWRSAIHTPLFQSSSARYRAKSGSSARSTATM